VAAFKVKNRPKKTKVNIKFFIIRFFNSGEIYKNSKNKT